jgi:ABC transport system ATP-binding/permease protein
MNLVLIRSPQTADEQVLRLKPGRNTLGSDSRNDLSVNAPGVLPYHLDINCWSDSVITVVAAVTDSSFLYQGKPCNRATIKPGEVFSIRDILFCCQFAPALERTQHVAYVPHAQGTASGPVQVGEAAASSQASGFLQQQAITFPLLIGRNPRCNLILDHPQVSGFHARITRESNGVWIEDLHSSNGTYVSDILIHKAPLNTGDSIVIMPYLLLYTGTYLNIYTFQRESQLIGWQVSVSVSAKKILDRVTIACNSNELVGLIGPSGSGKTTLMKCLSGQTLPGSGRVQLNGLEMYQHFPVFKHNIGFVPQDDILHRELSVHQTLMYAAKLRLPRDMSDKERKTRVYETLIELELEEQERQAVQRLSGGQRKRVNIAVELLTKPGILFLDEPTSGLDPALDEKLMILFKKLSQDGRITILTTHLLEHAGMFSKIALMHYGRLIFFGPPAEALDFFHVNAINALYSRIKEQPAEVWQEEFQKTSASRESVEKLRELVLPSRRKEVSVPVVARESPAAMVAQWKILSSRYLDIILRDRKNTSILLLQAPLIAFFIMVATSSISSRLFMMALAALWFGCNNSAREICKELPIYRRERMVNLSIIPYLGSKFVILSSLVVIQCLVLALLTPSDFLRAYWPLVLCGMAGIAMGLFVSSIVTSPDKAIALVPILLIPQVLFSGIFGELHGAKKLMSETMISKWSYNLLKKEFDLPSLAEKKKLEKKIDDAQTTMKDAHERVDSLQTKLNDRLNRMESTHDRDEMENLRYDARSITRQLQAQQRLIESAREEAENSEQQLRDLANRFVWIDRPDSNFEWPALVMFIIAFLAGAALQLKRTDRLLITL